MDKELIKMLEIRLEYYEKEFKNLKDKNDSEVVLKHGEKYYLAPLLKFVFPFIMFRLQNFDEQLEDYLVYIKDSFHEDIIKAVDKFRDNAIKTFPSVAKEILATYLMTSPMYQHASEDERENYVNDFCYQYELSIEKIAKYFPLATLNLIAQLKTPGIQFNLVRNLVIVEPIKKNIVNQLIHTDWNDWVEKYFCYPRTSSMEEYMDKWIARPQIHIKHGKVFFDVHYEAVKIWLKNKEKMKEKKNLENFNNK